MRILSIISLIAVLIMSSCSEETSINDDQKLNKNEEPTKEGDWKGCMVSAYIFQEDGRHLPQNFTDNITEFEILIEHEVGSIMWYPTFADEFPIEQCKKLKELGIIPHLTWELFIPDSVSWNTMNVDSSFQMMDDVLSGKYDSYIERFATDAKNIGSKVLIRFLHEFNGNWYVWSGNKNGREKGGPQKVIAVWKYVVDIFRSIGADNVKWIWNPHGPSIDLKEEEWNHIKNYWPGDDYVDWIGMDAYNWYPQDPWGGERPYRDFDNCFRQLYEECIKLGDQPIMIAEFGTSEFDYEGQTKADWIKDALNKIKNDYPKIKMFIWFHINKELDWRVNSSPESLKSFKESIKDSIFSGRI